MASRNLSDLQPEARELAQTFTRLAAEDGFTLLIYCTLRPFAEQAVLFRKGRALSAIRSRAEQLDAQYGRPDLAETLLNAPPQSSKNIVTWAGPGQSLHNYGMAFDGCPLLYGKPVWSPVDVRSTPDVDEGELWMQYGDLVRRAGLKWAGDWPKGKREYPHSQVPEFNWKDVISDT